MQQKTIYLGRKSRLPWFVRFVGAVTGRVYNEATDEHLADMLLVFYCAGGTVIGGLVCVCVAAHLFLNDVTPTLIVCTLPPAMFVGGAAGCVVTMSALNFTGLLRLERNRQS